MHLIRPLVLLQTISSGSGGRHMTHLHISPQFLQLVQPDLLLVGQPVVGPLYLHQLKNNMTLIFIKIIASLNENMLFVSAWLTLYLLSEVFHTTRSGKPPRQCL